MDLKHLRYVVQIADAGSLSKAAEMLRVAQPSLSLHLKSVEEELGVLLLSRHARGVALTEDGKTFVEHARRILNDMNQIPNVLRSTASSPTGRVSIGLPTSACRGLTLPLIDAGKRKFPGIDLHIVEAMTGYLEEWVQTGKIDAALLYNHKATENVAWTGVMSENLLLIAPVNTHIAGKKTIHFAEACELPLVLPGRPNTLRMVLERFAGRLDAELSVAIDCDSLTGILQLVTQGYFTVLPTFAVRHELAAGTYTAVPIVKPTPSWQLSVVLSKRTLNSRCSEAAADLLSETLKHLVNCGSWDATLER